MTTLVAAKDWLRDHLDDGARCPCCGQFAKIYRRRVHATMARELIAIWREAGCDWVHLPTLLKTTGAHGGDTIKVKYWNLIEPDNETREDGSTRTGWWRLTDSGRAFVLGEKSIPKYVMIYNEQSYGFSEDMVTIRDALGAKFDYQALMRGDA
jgi:hypothetical protein